jgi:hypothetical protein
MDLLFIFIVIAIFGLLMYAASNPAKDHVGDPLPPRPPRDG